MRLMNQISGTAMTPLNAAANTRACIGLMPMKFRHRPMSMDAAMIP
jgi:hypothetical protein